MNFNFASLLLAATLACGLIALVDWLFWRKKRHGNEKEPVLVEYARSFFPVLLFVLVLRSFVIEPFRIPSGSMEPTLNTGDFILVNKFTYGVRFPVTHTVLWENNKPQTGDVIVFRYPVNPNLDFIKRVVGTPGDRIEYQDKELYINGKKMDYERIGDVSFVDSNGNKVSVKEAIEDLMGVKHAIYQRDVNSRNFSVVVPEGHYFVMGDNRDDSDDSRSWGFVPEENLVGKAFAVWLSWNSHAENWYETIRWKRIGTSID
jgi:signal peptidase I